MGPTKPVLRPLVRPLIRSLVCDSVDADFPIPRYRYAYQADDEDHVVVAPIAGINGLDFTCTFDLFIIEHTDARRGVLGQCSTFTAPASGVSWRFVVNQQNEAQLAVRDGDAAGLLVQLVRPCPVGEWLTIELSVINETVTLSVEGDSVQLVNFNRIGAGADQPHLVFEEASGRADRMQIGNIKIDYANGTSLHWPCDEGAGLVMKDYVAKDLNSPTNGVISSDDIHELRRLENKYPNPDWRGGFPPDEHSLLFNTAEGRMVNEGEDIFSFESNYTEVSGRNVLGTNLPDGLVPGQMYRLECAVFKYNSGTYSAALRLLNTTNITVHSSYTIAIPGETNIVYYEFTPQAGYDGNIRIGCGTTADNTAHMLYSNPRIYRI